MKQKLLHLNEFLRNSIWENPNYDAARINDNLLQNNYNSTLQSNNINDNYNNNNDNNLYYQSKKINYSKPIGCQSLRPIFDHIKDIEYNINILNNNYRNKNSKEVDINKNMYFMQAQIYALKNSFIILSDVVVSEIEEIKSNNNGIVENPLVTIKNLEMEDKIDKRISSLVSTINILNNKFIEYTTSSNNELLIQRDKVKLLEELNENKKSESNETINKLNDEMIKLSESYKSIISEQEKISKYQALENLSLAQSIHELKLTIQSQNEAAAKNAITIQSLLENQIKLSAQNDINAQNIIITLQNKVTQSVVTSATPTPTSANLTNQFFGTGGLSKNASMTMASPSKGSSLLNKLSRTASFANVEDGNVLNSLANVSNISNDRQLKELNDKVSDLSLKVNRNNTQAIDLIQANEFEIKTLQSNVSKTFSLLSEHFDIANPWDLILLEDMKINSENNVLSEVNNKNNLGEATKE